MGRPRIEISEEALRAARASGRLPQECARELGVSPRSLYRRWNELGLPMTPRASKPTKLKDGTPVPRAADRYPAIVALHAEGLSAVESAKRLGVARCTVHKAWKVLGLSSPQYASRNLIIRQMAEADMTAVDIARTLGLYPTTVRDHLRNMGLQAGAPKRWGRGDEVEVLARQGFKTADIARRLGITYNSAWYHVTKRGLRPSDA